MELPRLKTIYQKFRDRGLRIVAVESMRDTETASKFVRENGLPYRFVENGDGKGEVVESLFGINSYPTSFLIDSEGKIVRVHVGFDEGDEKEYEKQIAELLDSRSL